MKRICIYVALGSAGRIFRPCPGDKYRTDRCPENKRRQSGSVIQYGLQHAASSLAPADGNHSLDNQPVGKRYARPAFSLHCRQKPLSHEQAERTSVRQGVWQSTGCGRGTGNDSF